MRTDDHPQHFAARNRTAFLENMATHPLDVLVIGGGITGCGIALDAAMRGFRTGLVEMRDFAFGTSSRSTKLIHGGLRYLKQGEIKLVREVGRERAVVYRNAPHLVRPEPLLLPLIEGGTYGKFMTSLGLWLYDRLAGVEKAERRVMLSREETLNREPLLKKDGLIGSGWYHEYRTDDARLTLEVVKTAVSKGALAVNHARVTDFIYQDGTITGAQVRDQINGREYRIKAGAVVNATGPWVDILRQQDGSLSGKRIRLSKGVHIVVDRSRFPLRQAVYFDVFDGRMVFAIPRDDKTYVGTTDTDYDGNLENPAVTEEDRNYLLRAVEDRFPSVRLNNEDIESEWAGLRPLIHQPGRPPSELSRRDEIFVSHTGLITIAGGKLTGYRKMAERVVDRLVAQFQRGMGQGKRFSPCRTEKQVLSGGDIGGPENWPAFVTEMKDQLAGRYGLEQMQAERLVKRYGSQVDRLAAYLDVLKKEGYEDSEKAVLRAELKYAMEHEMAVLPDDFLVRRTGDAYFNRGRYLEVRQKIEEWMDE